MLSTDKSGAAGRIGIAVFAFVAGAAAASAQIDPHGGMVRYPAVSKDHVAFVYANDLWIVEREGGAARPLASPPGGEMNPRFSPDGSTIAFMGNYDGDRDLYTIPVEGGVPHRVTHHPTNELLHGWTPDGRLIYSASGFGGSPGGKVPQLFTVDARGGLPERLPVPYGNNGAVSGDGEWLAYNPTSRDFRTWKRYRGGMANDIWLFNLENMTSRQMTDWEGTDTIPMWHGGKVYYLSDQGDEHRLNIWMFDPSSGQREQLTRFSEYDVKWPSMGPGPRGQGEIVFQNGAEVYLFDLRGRSSQALDVTIPGDRPRLRDQRTDVSDTIQARGISSTGKRAVVQARGDIWTAPAEHGAPRNLTATPGVAERDPAWSPDGRWVAYFSDESGEYNLYVTQSDGKGETKQLTDMAGRFFSNPKWAPDSDKILFQDQTGAIHLLTIESGELRTVDVDPWAGGAQSVSFSHDGRWIAYDKGDPNNGNVNSIWIYNVESGEAKQVTSNMFDDQDPVFDRIGDWLYFRSKRSFSPTYEDYGTTFIYDDTEVLVAAPLRADMESPYKPKSDEESWDDEKSDEDDEEASGEEDEENGEGDDAADEAPDDGLSGVWEGMMTGPDPVPPGGMPFTLSLTLSGDGDVDGAITTPLGAGAISSGSFNSDSGELNLIIQFEGDGPSVEIRARISGDSMTGTATADAMGVTADLSGTRTSKAGEGDDDDGPAAGKAREVVEIDFDGFEARAMQLPVSRGNFYNLAVNDKSQLLYVRAGESAEIKLFDINDEKKQEKTVLSASGGFDVSGDGKKILSGMMIANAAAGATPKPFVRDGMSVMIPPREEWENLVVDAWRRYRDFFYDPTMHSVDWDATLDAYLAMLPDATTREDVSYIIREMISELNVGHAYYRGGGDTESEPSENVGLLGADYEVVETDDGSAYRISRIYRGAPWDLDARGPLGQPGVDVNEGDFLLAVNGAPLSTDIDPWSAFIGLAGRPTSITVSEKPVIDEDAREALIEPVGSEYTLRYRDWIEQKRAYVEEKTGGGVGYIYVPDTGVNGQNDLVRQFVGQIDKDGLIIDERWNGGGQIPTRFVELLNRPRTNYWARRHGNDWPWPPDSHQGPKAMLINGLAGSGGDAFPFYFKQAGLGPLIGTRTWGGLVGITGMPSLIDGANISVPNFAFYELDGTWGIEGHGVDPDIEVIDDPARMVDGGDPQLDKAIEVVTEAIRENPYEKPVRPAYPDRSGMGLPEEDR